MSRTYPWFRFFDETLDDPKVQQMPSKLFMFWVNTLSLANRGEPRGSLPSVPHIAFALRIDTDTAQKLVDELLKRQLLDEVDGTLIPHNWHKRQFASDHSTPRVQAYREKKKARNDANSDETVDETFQRNRDETLPETVSKRSVKPFRNVIDTDTDTEKETEIDIGSARKAREPKRARMIDPEWKPGFDLVAQMAAEGINERRQRRELPQFIDHHLNSRPLKDVPAAYRKWMRNALKFDKNGRESINDDILESSAPIEDTRTPEEIAAEKERRRLADEEHARKVAERKERAIEEAETDPARPVTIPADLWSVMTPERRARYALAR
jgi:hypothetical protein